MRFSLSNDQSNNSGSLQLPITAERALITPNWAQYGQHAKQCSALVGSREEQPNIWIAVAKNAFVGFALNFRVRMLLKGFTPDIR